MRTESKANGIIAKAVWGRASVRWTTSRSAPRDVPGYFFASCSNSSKVATPRRIPPCETKAGVPVTPMSLATATCRANSCAVLGASRHSSNRSRSGTPASRAKRLQSVWSIQSLVDMRRWFISAACRCASAHRLALAAGFARGCICSSGKCMTTRSNLLSATTRPKDIVHFPARRALEVGELDDGRPFVVYAPFGG